MRIYEADSRALVQAVGAVVDDPDPGCSRGRIDQGLVR